MEHHRYTILSIVSVRSSRFCLYYDVTCSIVLSTFRYTGIFSGHLIWVVSVQPVGTKSPPKISWISWIAIPIPIKPPVSAFAEVCSITSKILYASNPDLEDCSTYNSSLSVEFEFAFPGTLEL